jgi:hypothetical protein
METGEEDTTQEDEKMIREISEEVTTRVATGIQLNP